MKQRRPMIAAARDGRLGVDTLNWQRDRIRRPRRTRVRGWVSLPPPPPPPPPPRSGLLHGQVEKRFGDKLRGAIGVEVLLTARKIEPLDLVRELQDVGQRLADAIIERA